MMAHRECRQIRVSKSHCILTGADVRVLGQGIAVDFKLPRRRSGRSETHINYRTRALDVQLSRLHNHQRDLCTLCPLIRSTMGGKQNIQK